MRNSTLKKISRASRALKARLSSALLDPRPDGHVLMLHCGRSGSTLLGDMMDQHPDVFWDGEVVEKMLHSTSRKEGVGIDHLQGRFSLEDVIDKNRHRMRTRAGGKIYGMEIQDYHMKFINCSAEEFLSNARNMGFTNIIYLDRNPIRKLVSHLVATNNGEWHIGVNQRSSKPKIRINPDRIYIGHSMSNLKDSLDQMIYFKKDIDQFLYGEQYLRLGYDADIRSDPTVALSKVCAYLGIPEHKPKIKFAKTADLKLSDLIENYLEVESELFRSGHLSEDDYLNRY